MENDSQVTNQHEARKEYGSIEITVTHQVPMQEQSRDAKQRRKRVFVRQNIFVKYSRGITRKQCSYHKRQRGSDSKTDEQTKKAEGEREPDREIDQLESERVLVIKHTQTRCKE